MTGFHPAVVSVCDPKADGYVYLDDLDRVAPDGAEFVVRAVRDDPPEVVAVGLDREALASFARSTLRYLAASEDRLLSDEDSALIGDGKVEAPSGELTTDTYADKDVESALNRVQAARVSALWEARSLLAKTTGIGSSGWSPDRYDLTLLARFILTGSDDVETIEVG